MKKYLEEILSYCILRETFGCCLKLEVSAMNTKEILEFVYKIVQIMNGIIDILKCLYDINNQKEEKKGGLYILKKEPMLARH